MGDFIIQRNGFRKLRPGVTKEKALGKQPDLSPHEERCQFACRDGSLGWSLLNQEPLFERNLNGTIWRAYKNASPFEKDGHFILVPDIFDDKQIRPQKLIEKDILDMVTLMEMQNSQRELSGAIWEQVNLLQQRGIPFNLIFRGSNFLIFFKGESIFNQN